MNQARYVRAKRGGIVHIARLIPIEDEHFGRSLDFTDHALCGVSRSCCWDCHVSWEPVLSGLVGKLWPVCKRCAARAERMKLEVRGA